MVQTDNRPLLIAITGGIASGKTIVCKWFEKEGFIVIYADKLGHEILKEKEIVKAVEDEFGIKANNDGLIDRKLLSQIVFNEREKLLTLNKILHPKIRKRMQMIIDSAKEEYLIFEIPLLFENGLNKCFDLNINISAEKEIRIDRIIARDGTTREETIKKISTQLSNKIRTKRADINIRNNLKLDRLYAQLTKIKEYISKFEKKDIQKIVEE